jgi:hypothetical protein
MRFQDFFVPRWQHSNPEVRRNAIQRLSDARLLAQISQQDDDEMVRMAARDRHMELEGEQITENV